MEEGVDTVGNGVLLLFGGQDVFLKSWMEEGVETGCCCCLEENTFFEILGGVGF